jgi:hypothetical protein
VRPSFPSKKLVMAGLVPATHFPETEQNDDRFWKMGPRHRAGDDGLCFVGRTARQMQETRRFSATVTVWAQFEN